MNEFERELAKLRSRIERIPPTALSSVTYRSVIPEFANDQDLLSGEGSRKYGGRWNPPGIAAVYFGLSPETAMAEVLGHYRYYQIPLYESMPRVFIAVQVQLSRVIDLTVGTNRAILQVSEQRMLRCDWRAEAAKGRIALTQLVGQAMCDSGVEGFVVRSAESRVGENLIVFPQNLRALGQLQVMHPN